MYGANQTRNVIGCIEWLDMRHSVDSQNIPQNTCKLLYKLLYIVH